MLDKLSWMSSLVHVHADNSTGLAITQCPNLPYKIHGPNLNGVEVPQGTFKAALSPSLPFSRQQFQTFLTFFKPFSFLASIPKLSILNSQGNREAMFFFLPKAKLSPGFWILIHVTDQRSLSILSPKSLNVELFFFHIFFPL